MDNLIIYKRVEEIIRTVIPQEYRMYYPHASRFMKREEITLGLPIPICSDLQLTSAVINEVDQQVEAVGRVFLRVMKEGGEVHFEYMGEEYMNMFECWADSELEGDLVVLWN